MKREVRITSAPPVPVPRPVAAWDFRGSDWRVDSAGRFELIDGDGSAVTQRPGAIHFDGAADYLRIARADVADLDIARTGHEVTVIALARRLSLDTGFIAGLWQEHDHDPRRQYGLFLSLPTYGGSQQVIGHVSSDGAPSENLPYSRDYSASARMVAPGGWRVVGFTYDGSAVTSYLDGVADARPAFTERGAPLGAERSYAKNPYLYPHGLNSDATSEFTVGAVRLTGGMGNFFAGDLARLAVWDAALTPDGMMAVARDWTPPGSPLLQFDFYRPGDGVDRVSGGWDGERWPLDTVGWTVLEGTGATWVEPGSLVHAGGHATVAFTGIRGLRAEDVRVTVDGDARVLLGVDGDWVAPNSAEGPLEGIALVLDAPTRVSRVVVA